MSPKPKPAKPAKIAAKPEPSPLSKEIDELGELEAWSHTFAVVLALRKLDRIDSLRKALRARFAGAPGHQQATGERFVAVLGILGAPCEVSFTRAGSRSLKVYEKA